MFKNIVCIILVLLPIPIFGQQPLPDSTQAKYCAELDTIVRHIEQSYIFGRRGISDSTWNSRLDTIRAKIYAAKNFRQYRFALRYVGALSEDGHLKFPDNGQYNRVRIFQKTDTLLPLWVKTWTDGRVFVTKDYTGTLPRNAEIISVNGHSAQQIALTNRAIFPAEDRFAMASMNASTEPDCKYWTNFANFLFMEGVSAPYKVVYIAPGSNRPDTVILCGMMREDIFKIYKRSGDKRAVRRRNGGGLFGKFMEFKNVGGGVGLLTIDSFWGKDLLELMIFNTDNKYANRLKNTMARIARHKIDTLIIDISNNRGGMADNIYKTLNYFTTKPIDANETYCVTDANRAIAKIVATSINGKLFGLSKENLEQLGAFIDSLPSGTTFSTDSVLSFDFKPHPIKHRYTGKLYLVTSARSFSAAQQFTQHFTDLGIGITVGQPCGGYRSISGGNGHVVRLPLVKSWDFILPYSKMGRKSDADRFEYEKVDIPIEITFEEWLRDENHTVPKLLEIIKNSK